MQATTGVFELLDCAQSVALIRCASEMTAGMARYWHATARRLGRRVDVVDPWRADLRTLRAEYPRGTRVYRASTGGRWGKSATIVTL